MTGILIGSINNELSKKVLATRIPGGPIFTKNLGIYFNPETWDSSDFFTPEGTLFIIFIIVTKKVKELIEENKLINIRITPITEVENFIL